MLGADFDQCHWTSATVQDIHVVFHCLSIFEDEFTGLHSGLWSSKFSIFVKFATTASSVFDRLLSVCMAPAEEKGRDSDCL